MGTLFRLKLLLCAIFIFCSLQKADTEIGVHQGDLRAVNCSTAILSMSGDATHKTIWWQFLPLLQEYSEALRVYMVAAQIPQGYCKVEDYLQHLGGVLFTRNASIAEDISVVKVRSLGTMSISMWMLGFLCPEENACTPVVLLKDLRSWSYTLHSVWEIDGDAAKNTAPARILNLPNTNLEVGNRAITFRSIQADDLRIPLCNNRTRSRVHRMVSDVVPKLKDTCGENKPGAGAPAEQLNPLCIHPENTTTIYVEKLIGTFMTQVKSSYIQAQVSAVNLDQGLVTEFWIAAIAGASAYLAVVAAAFPITDFLLRIIRKKLPWHHLRVLLICILNSVVSIFSYAAVLTLVPAELERQKSYETWGLLADEIPVVPHGLQVLIIVQGNSCDKSSSLIIMWVSFVLLIPIMACISLYRCNQVAKRRKLLRKLRKLRPEEPGDERLDDLRAIEMTCVEQELLEKTLQDLENAANRPPTYATNNSPTPRSLGRVVTFPSIPGLDVRLRVDGERSGSVPF